MIATMMWTIPGALVEPLVLAPHELWALARWVFRYSLNAGFRARREWKHAVHWGVKAE